jgi:bis(5'-nucleosyl)-tetraphosphatase (symmetrical)
MATWAIGDVHGCYRTLRRLLARRSIGREDRLWFVGDLVNRGPRSLETLRFVADLGERATVVLGNHDIHCLAVARGVAQPRKKDTFDRLLRARDRDELLTWLAARPLLSTEGGRVLVHAGLLFGWTLRAAERRARSAERALRDPVASVPFLRAYRPAAAPPFGPEGNEAEILESIRVTTLLRTVRGEDGEPLYEYAGTVADRPRGSVPWFDVAKRRSARVEIVFGHWAALGLMVRPDAIALDTGCAWGGALTAIRLEDRRIEQTENVD